MRRRPLFWLSVSILCFVAASYFWQLGDKWTAQKAAAPPAAATDPAKPANPAAKPVAGHSKVEPIRLFSELQPTQRASAPATNATPDNLLRYRLSNTPKKLSELARSGNAILLENALLDTAQSMALPIPDSLRAQADPGTYIVQSRKPLDKAFRSLLQRAGATIVAYIPNNAYLVRASQGVAQGLSAQPQTQAVLPYEPYYKLKPSLLKLAVDQQPLPGELALNLLLFADGREATLQALKDAGVPVLGETRSPFGPVVKVQPPVDGLATLAGLSGVQVIEVAHTRVLANDLSRATIGVAADSVTPDNYMGLTGSNVLVNINDTGVDATHPDLEKRVFLDPLDLTGISAIDTDGHGTHVAGIIAGSGSKSTTVSNAPGSTLPPVDGQFRGKAPGASLFSLPWTANDSYLQETAARTNAFISNNSWTYGAAEYDLAAASYDAAVRDSLPAVTGAQPLVYVFPAGNGGVLRRPGSNNDDGVGGSADGIQSPGTAKNVITVGSAEQLRNITNEVERVVRGIYYTNTPWVAKSDATNEVASYSSRGNVGVEYEGKFGRFKPDVVAPGSFVISARSSMWDEQAYYNPTNSRSVTRLDVVNTNQLRYFINFIPENAVQWTIDVWPDFLPIYVKQSDFPTTSSYDLLGTNMLSLPPDRALDPVDQNWCFAVGNSTNQALAYTITSTIFTTNDFGNYLDVLSNLNNSISGSAPHYYRYESGTSMAAADVAGTLALMQEFFEQRMHQTNSPALMKALLINGARSLGNGYDFQVTAGINYQGWGQVQLPTTISSNLLTTAGTASRPTFLFDQNPTNALATAQSHTRFFSLSPAGRNQPLRVTLVWTDPPGNPITSIKLVNDLDLIVTNLDTGDVFIGNDIIAGTDYNSVWDTNSAPNVDFVNNVENVYLQEPLGTNYSITVVAHHVNVNAVSAHTNDVVQDYALVVSSGDGAVPDALTLKAEPPIVAVTAPYVTVVTNSFPESPDNPTSGGILLNQHVGANTPLLGTNQVPLEGANVSGAANGVITLGMTNQWHFYVISNDFNYTNAAFVTFMPPNQAVPRIGVNVADPNDATRLEADIDLYVSTDYNLTNLSPAAIAAAQKSLSRGGTEVIAISNAVPAGVYYVGVKSEDQQAAEYGFLGIFSLYPFSTTDADGNQYLRGLPAPSFIPNGTMLKPNSAMLFGIGILPTNVRRVVVTNGITHDSVGDLLGVLTHNHKYATLNNHSCAHDPADPNRCLTSYTYVYEDNGEGNVVGSKPSDGPGTLKNFIGEQGLGLWMLNMVNSSLAYTGRVDNLFIKLEPQNLDTTGTPRDVLPHTFTYDYIDIPANATNLTVCVSGNTDPMELYVRRVDLPSQTLFDYHLTINPPGGCLPISIFDNPPLTPGRYYIGVYNPSSNTQHIRLLATVYRNPFAIASTVSGFSSPVPILDDAVTYAYITNTAHLPIADLDVSLLINHPRISDLAITLISPNGTRVVLFEDRGATWTNGLGTFNNITNSFGIPVFGATNLMAFYTNDFEASAVGPYAPGAVFQGWNVLTNFVKVNPDLAAPWMSNNVLILGDGVVSNSLPTTNSTAYSLSYKVTHAPYLVGTVGWWPMDGDGADIFGGFNGLLSGNVSFSANTGMVNQAYFGDGTATRMIVPRAPALDVGQRPGFAVEGWIRPNDMPLYVPGAIVMSDSFESVPVSGSFQVFSAGAYFSGGWHVDSGEIDVENDRSWGSGSADTGRRFLDLNGFMAGTVSTNLALVPGKSYRLSFAYAPNPDARIRFSLVPKAAINLNGSTLLTLTASLSNTWDNLGWQSTSVVFTATSASVKLELQSLNANASGILFDTFTVSEYSPSGLIVDDGFEGAAFLLGVPTGSTVSGWLVESGDVDIVGPVYNYKADSGDKCVDLNGNRAGAISTKFNTTVGQKYRLSFAYTKNGNQSQLDPSFVGRAMVSLSGQPDWQLIYDLSNSVANLNWSHTSYVFTASSPLTTLKFTSLNSGVAGIFLDSFKVQALGNYPEPLVEWYDPASTNGTPQGVQFWLSGLPGTNAPGSLWVNLWDTNSQPHLLTTVTNAITNGGWQHVAFSFDAPTRVARLYTNGQLAAAQVVSATNFVPRTSGDLYFGFDPPPTSAAISYPAFNSTSGLNLVGSAALFNSALRLTPAAYSQVGDAWAKTKQSCAAGFDTQFQFRISNRSPGMSGDGLTFTVQNQGPAAMGFEMIDQGPANFVSVYFNTFHNWPGCTDFVKCDVSDSSVGIVIPNGYVAQTDLLPFGIDIRDGAVHTARILYNGSGLTVTVDGVIALNNIAVPGMKQATDSTGLAWVGFSAACGGGGNENHDILSWTFGNPAPWTAFGGGLDEFGLYQRPLSDCEVAAIFHAGAGGKYGTNVLTCPVTNAVQLITSVGTLNFAFTNGYAWSTNGPAWETNTIYFNNLLTSAVTNGPATNVTALVLKPLDPNVQVDDFVLSALLTNYVNGLLNFTDNTNLALLPIKFAPAPYQMSNFPPTLIFSNDFENVVVTQAVYKVGDVLRGSTNNPLYGPRDWTVSAGPISVVSNTVFDAEATNWVALAGGGVECLLPTTPGHRYQLTYNLRGPGAVSWWSGDIEPLSRRAWDLLSANNGAFLEQATNSAAAFVGTRALYFNGKGTNGLGTKLELGDPPTLALTNALTIEGWVQPIKQTNYSGTEQILFRGDRRGDANSSLFSPYYLALEPKVAFEPMGTTSRDLHFHIADTTNAVELLSTNAPINVGQWQHIAAVFEMNVPVPGQTWTTNQVRLYLNGACIASNYTAITPFRDLDPAFSAGVAIGNRARTDYSQPFRGYLDELSVYGRVLTDPEIALIAASGAAGKADFTVAPAQSLAAVNVVLDNVLVDQGHGDNSKWTTRSVTFSAERTNMVLNFQSLMPGTLLDGITLTELPAELNYMPEQPLSALNGEDGYGVWKLEIWDTRAGGGDTNNLPPSLLNWVLNFTLTPSNAPPVIQLAHGIPYTNSLTAYGVQNFVVQVPQWATNATNELLFALDRNNPTVPLPVGVFFDLTNQAPCETNTALFVQPVVTTGTNVLTPDTNTTPHMVIGQPYYITVSNPNPVAVTYALGAWFDIVSLTNCVANSNYVNLAGIPRYFQIDVTNTVPDNLPTNFPPQEVVFHLTGVDSNYVGFRSNVTVVLSQHLPLPDLRHYDYISQDVRTNDDVILVLTNTTPFPIQTNRWYIGVFNNAATNVPFTVQACYTTNLSPMIVPLVDSVPRSASAPPGPPKWLFYEFEITDNTDGVLFELYNLSGDVDLVLQRDIVPGMATYLDGSFRAGLEPEQIVLRPGIDFPNLRGKWFLGVYNNEVRNVDYTIRASLQHDGILLSGLNITQNPPIRLQPPHGVLISWNAVAGQLYAIDYVPDATSGMPIQLGIGYVRATTPLATYEDVEHQSGTWVVRPVSGMPTTQPRLLIQLVSTNQVRISWPTNFFAPYRQYSDSVMGPWTTVTNWPISIINSNYVILEPLTNRSRFYRLTQ